MALSAAETQKRYRERARYGRRIVPVEVDAALIEDALVARGFLLRQDADDPAKVAVALREAITQLIAPPPEPDEALPITPRLLDL